MPVGGRDPGAPSPPRPPRAWQGSKRAPDCYALCFWLRAEPAEWGWHKLFPCHAAVALKGAAFSSRRRRPGPGPPTPPLSRLLDPFPRGDLGLTPGSGREGTKRPARMWRGPRGRGTCGGSPAGRKSGCALGSAPGARRGWGGENREKARRRRREGQGPTWCQVLPPRTTARLESSQRFCGVGLLLPIPQTEQNSVAGGS